MEWAPEQERAIRKVQEWFDDPDSEQVFTLFGYAGTGKTTIAREFGAAAGGTVLYGAYTAKAALVMTEKGCAGAETIHRMIYVPVDKSPNQLIKWKADRQILQERLVEEEEEGERTWMRRQLEELNSLIVNEESGLAQPSFVLNDVSGARDADLIIIDEVSMVGAEMGRDLLSFGAPVLVIGDPGQLPPVASEGYFTSREPDILLEEIHRQAKDSPIIDIATRVRLGDPLPLGYYGNSRVVGRGKLSVSEVMSHDQILVGKNRTRRTINDMVRKELGRKDPYPEVGDVLVCLKNNYREGLLNGSIWETLGVEDYDEDELVLVVSDGSREIECRAHKGTFEHRDMSAWEFRGTNKFDFGYALTVHKAQGSQWGSVAVVDESGSFRQDARKWLYTGVTRAAEKVTVIR